MAQVLYADPKALRNVTGPGELAQVATPETALSLVTATDMNTCINAGGGSGTADAMTAWKKINDALTRASALIDTKLRNVYTLPLTVVPPILSEYCCEIARFYLHRNGATDDIKYRYEAAMQELKGVVSGVVDLGAVGSDTLGVVTAGLGIISAAPARDNTYDTLSQFDSVLPCGVN